MSGAWSNGANRAVAAAPPAGSMGARGRGGTAPGGRGAGGGAAGGAAGGRGAGGGWNRGGGGTGPGNRNNRRKSSNSTHQNGEGGRGGGGHRGGQGRGRGGNRNNQNRRGGKYNNQGGRGGNKEDNHVQITHKDVQLLEQRGIGDTPAQQAVTRITAKEFIRQRMMYLDPGSDFSPHDNCLWKDEKRLAEIRSMCSQVVELGDVTFSEDRKQRKETAPPLEDCKPLEINEEKRWKSKAMKSDDEEAKTDPETQETAMSNALAILNKISWTTLEKLTVQFMEVTQVEENEAYRKATVAIIMEKAQTEHHFGAMYAQLCATISKQVKAFKRELLEQCQREFEMDTAHKIEAATKDATSQDEINYHSTLIRKAYVGHMKFLGELYLLNVVKLSVMMHCLDELLKDLEHEESLECFANLMTTMGEKLEGHAKLKNDSFDWQRVVDLRHSTKISSRIKFMMQDLLDLRDRGWVKRRKEETAKSIADLHKEVAKEEKAAKQSGRRSVSISTTGSLKRSSSLANAAAAAAPDTDGFVPVSRGSIKKVGSRGSIAGETSLTSAMKPKAAALRRSQSQPASMTSQGSPPSPDKKNPSTANSLAAALQQQEAVKSKPTLDPEECSRKIKNILKEYFVSGETDDAVLSVDELVQVGQDGSVERGAKVVEGAAMLVMEMKAEHVEKMMVVMTKSVQGGKLEQESIVNGLSDPLEFLSDIEIDAPLAGNHLASIAAECIKLGVLSLDFLKNAPEFFRTDGKPAAFAAKVLKQRGGDASEEEVGVVEALMTEDDKKNFDSAKAMLA